MFCRRQLKISWAWKKGKKMGSSSIADHQLVKWKIWCQPFSLKTVSVLCRTEIIPLMRTTFQKSFSVTANTFLHFCSLHKLYIHLIKKPEQNNPTSIPFLIFKYVLGLNLRVSAIESFLILVKIIGLIASTFQKCKHLLFLPYVLMCKMGIKEHQNIFSFFFFFELEFVNCGNWRYLKSFYSYPSQRSVSKC